MPLYDCLLMMKRQLTRVAMEDLVGRVARRVYQRNGVITDIKSFGTVQLGYGIKKLDGRHYEGQLMQMTFMVPPNFPKELQYLNKEDQLLRWLVVKHRNTKYGLEFVNEYDGRDELSLFRTGGLYSREDDDDDDDDDDDENYDEGDEENK
ncbi:putative ribosomal protein S6 [Dioscorea sansibarensis]